MLKKLLALTLALCSLFSLAGCSGKEAVTESTTQATAATETTEAENNTYTFTDAHDREISMDKNPQKVVVLSGSFAEMWEIGRAHV